MEVQAGQVVSKTLAQNDALSITIFNKYIAHILPPINIYSQDMFILDRKSVV